MTSHKIVDTINSLKLKENTNSMSRLNEKLVGVLDELNTLLLRQGEPFRAKAYREASDVIIQIEEDITNIEQLNGLSKIGATIYNKLDEFINTGTLQVLEREKNNPLNLLTKVYGIGPKKAKEFISKGWTTLNDLKQHPESLTSAMKLGLLYFDDIESRIPRSEIECYKDILTSYFNPSNHNDKFEIVGSYRRGKPDSGDIDIIITGDTDKVFKEFIDNLIESKIIIAVLSRGKIKCLAISQLPGEKARRIDFMYSPLDEYAFATLYFTGSKIFNTIQRQRALDLGLTLNEHGFYKVTNGTKSEKLMKHFPNEETIFKYLGMEYIEPEQRIDSRSVKYIKKENTIKENTIKKKPMPKNISKKPLRVLPVRKTQKKSLIKSPSKNIKIFKTEGIEALKNLNEDDLSSMIQTANDAYYENNTSLLTDNQYDILREYTLNIYPNNQIAKSGHTQCDVQKNKATLPYEMGSMDKIKPDTQALSKWLKTYDGPFVLSCKLDGVSGLYSTEGDEPKLYTRGNGIIGQDISHIIPYLDLPDTKGLVIRGEFIIKKEVFKQKYKKNFANPRNFVAGLINQKKIDPIKYKDIDFVAYELIKPETNPSLQLKALDSLNICVVQNTIVTNITNDLLSNYLAQWRDEYIYEIDGIICCDDKIYPRKSGNPDHAFAFKMVLSDQIAEVKVVNVEWNPSKDGYLKPRVQIEPIKLGGVRIEHATGFNGAFIYNNNIGVGSLIKIIRSGDVIPHILQVIEQAETPLMPSVPYSWTKGNIDIILDNKDDDIVVKEKIITAFFKNIGVEGLGPGNVRKIINAGYNSIEKILFMDEEDYLNIDGFGTKLAKKIYNNIHANIKKATLPEIMTASHVFGRGFGNKKFIAILEAYPDILISDLNSETKITNLTKISGMSDKTAAAFVECIPHFTKWSKCNIELQNKLLYQKTQILGDPNGPLYKKTIVTTGISSKARNCLADKLVNVGGILEKTINKDTFAVLVINMDEDTDKANKARSMNIPIMLVDDFIKKYNL